MNQSVLEPELTSFCATTFLQGKRASARDFMALLQSNTIDEISGLLSATLADEVEAGKVSLAPVSPGVPLPTRFQRILSVRRRGDKKIDSIALFVKVKREGQVLNYQFFGESFWELRETISARGSSFNLTCHVQRQC